MRYHRDMNTITSLPKAMIFDFDGTLVDVRGILPLIDRSDKNLTAFHLATHLAPANDFVFEMVEQVIALGIQPILITARGEMWREVTVDKLITHGFNPQHFFMRKDDDFRPGSEYKRELFLNLRKEWDIVAAIDDDDSVVAMWESEQTPVIHVPGYNGVDDPYSVEIPEWWNQLISGLVTA